LSSSFIGKIIVSFWISSVQISKSNFKGAKESHLYKYMLTIENCDYVDSASYTCKVGDQETQGTLTITKSELRELRLLY